MVVNGVFYSACTLAHKRSHLQGRELLAFERYMFFKSKGGNHLQFNVLSIPAKSAADIKAAYLAEAKQNDLKFKPVNGPSQVGFSLCIRVVPTIVSNKSAQVTTLLYSPYFPGLWV